MMPKDLTKKLEFGNPAQIKALKTFELEIAKQEEILGKKLDGHLNKYMVTIRYLTEETIEVWASNIEEAKDSAREMANAVAGEEIMSVSAENIS